MSAPILVSDLVNQVRDQIDETSVITVSDDDIVQALNRGQSYAWNIMARHYAEPLIHDPYTLSLTSGTATYDLPEDMFEDRMVRVEILNSSSNIAWEVSRVSIREGYKFESSSTAAVPTVYSIYGRTIKFYATPNGAFNARLWYLRRPEPLTLNQGMITVISGTSLTFNTLGDYDADTNPHGVEPYDTAGAPGRLTCWVNVADAQTGEIKGTYEVAKSTDVPAGVTAEVLSIDAAPERTTVINRTVGTALASTIAVDDVVSNVRGVGTVYFPFPLTNFLIQFAVNEERRRLHDSPDMESRILKEFEQQVERSWVGRESTLKVARKSANWSSPYRRWWGRGP